MKNKGKIPYLTQYCNLEFEWLSKGIDIDNATESQASEISDLQKKAIEQSGLSRNEMALIVLCRKHGIFKKVNIYARKLMNLKL